MLVKIRYYNIIILLFLFMASADVMSQEIPPPRFTNPPENKVDAGHIKLIWEADSTSPEVITFELQQSTDSTFQDNMILYKGPDLAKFISGLPNGRYYYRIRTLGETGDIESDWSKPLVVIVQHHSLSMAFTLFGIGAVVFLLTASMVIYESRKAMKGELE